MRCEAMYPLLLSPIRLRGHELRNRVVFTAHTASFSEDGIPGIRAREYYAARASGGAGLIVMEPLPVLPSAGVTPQNYRWRDARFGPGLTAVCEAVHEHGTVLVSQLYHLGPNADPTATMEGLWSVSAGSSPDGGPGLMREIDAHDIAALVDGHVEAARTALAAGVDGVECMFAYDTLVDGFMSETRNRRADGYGGSLENRMRLAREILDALRDALGPEPLLGVTLTASMPGYVEAAAHLRERCDVDYFGIGNGDYDHLELLMPTLDFEPGFGVRFAEQVKRAVPEAVVIAEGRITRPELGERALREGCCDLVGMTRAQIADPDLVRKAELGRDVEIRECVALNVCVSRRLRKFPIACVQNPEAGFEAEPTPRAPQPRRVVVVGGGVAGLEAARAAALAGHAVRLLERTDELGGQVALTARLPRQGAHLRLVEWRAAELDRLEVRVETGVEADADGVARLEPERVLVATGSEPEERFPAALSATAVLAGAELPEGPVVVLDEEGHRKGAGVAELLARHGRSVTLVGEGLAPAGQLAYSLAAAPSLQRLREAGVRIVADARIVEVEGGRVVLELGDLTEELEVAAVVHAGRHRPVDALVGALRDRGIRAVAVGDARVPRLVEDAVRSGWEAARAL
jgi:2,4-dienoyl-CoA reductase-like NADH-dependent reductase (Old Yellow Enzyme family)/thioredoxin reductase